jgi:ATP-dependent Clp protease ATP-binding subunit ClpA
VPRINRFSARARLVLAHATEEARRLNHNYIGTEHLLLGLIRESEGVAAKVLHNLGIELSKVREAVEFTIGRGNSPVADELGLTPRAKVVVELAVKEARKLGHQYIGTEHLLLGLVREGEGIAAGILTSLGAALAEVRLETLRVLTGGGPVSVRGFVEAGMAKDNVVSCRIDDADLNAIDTLIEAGIRSTRSDAAAWLIHAGIQAQQALFAKVNDTVEHIRRLRQEAQSMAQEHAATEIAPADAGAEEAQPVERTGQAELPN